MADPVTGEPGAKTVLNAESGLTDRYQTTVPETVRRALGLKKRGRISYQILGDGRVIMGRQEKEDEEDPVVAGFLAFLADDMEKNPSHIQPLDGNLMDRVSRLTKGVAVDLEGALDPQDD